MLSDNVQKHLQLTQVVYFPCKLRLSMKEHIDTFDDVSTSQLVCLQEKSSPIIIHFYLHKLNFIGGRKSFWKTWLVNEAVREEGGAVTELPPD